MAGGLPKVSLIATCLNEGETISDWWASVSAQTKQPDEIVIADGGSSDETVPYLRAVRSKVPVRVLVAPGANVPTGRNIAISEARGELIAICDVGTVLEPNWLEKLLEPFESDPDLDVSAGFFRPDGRGRFQRILAAVITPNLDEIHGDDFLPSSRSLALRREWWENVGGYPEWLRWSEDVVFDLALRRAGARFAFAPAAIVSWHPPSTPAGFLRQYRFYARGDGQYGLWATRHALRYGYYALLAALLLRGGVIPRALALALLNSYMRRFFWRVRKAKPAATTAGGIAAQLAVPPIVIGGDVAKMIGYAEGRLERMRAGSREELARRIAADPIAYTGDVAEARSGSDLT